MLSRGGQSATARRRRTRLKTDGGRPRHKGACVGRVRASRFTSSPSRFMGAKHEPGRRERKSGYAGCVLRVLARVCVRSLGYV